MRGNDYPRVLIVAGGPMSRRSGAGITVSNLFERWPKDCLAQVYMGDEEPDSRICAQTFRLGGRCAPFDFYVRKLLGKHTLRYAPATPGLASMGRGADFGIKTRVHVIARALNDMSLVQLPGGLKEWVGEVAPNVIYSLLGSVRVMKITLAVSRMSGRPLVAHFMDDWPKSMHSGGILYGYPRRSLHRTLAKIFQRSPFGLCIGEEMAEEYKRRYELPFHPFMNCVDEVWFAKPELRKPDRAVVTYIGGLHLDRWKPLVTIGRAVVELGCEMRIFMPQKDLERHSGLFNGLEGIRLGSLAPERVFHELECSDVAVHVESFDADISAYTRYSVSTKIPQYMAAAKPILACGPDQLASMGVIRRADAGIVLGNDDLETTRATLANLLKDQTQRLRLAQNGYTYARKHFSKESVQKRFQTIMADAASLCAKARELPEE